MWTPEVKTHENFTLWVTHECNMNCVFCRDSENQPIKGFMTMEEVARSLTHAKETGIKTVLIGGGEPTLHPNIIEIAQMSKDMGFFTVITTNYTKPESIKALDGICDTINISVYPENKDSIPSQKNFKSNIYLKVLLYKGRFETKEDFDAFIDRYEQLTPNMGFCCMRGHTEWCEEHKDIEWLNSLPIEKEVMTDRGNPCWIYRGHVIDRKDLSTFKKAHMMVDVRGLLFDKQGKWVLPEESEAIIE
ncbi:MAG: radical SAM protein [Oscillospiraceae bacterium]|nr:radical SAM protein [Oscillospiraceae bacterium]